MGSLEIGREIIQFIPVQLQVVLHSRDICVILRHISWDLDTFNPTGQYNVDLIKVFKDISQKSDG